MDKIDFVITWVDGSDPVWREQKNRYSPEQKSNAVSDNRFRDWELLRYWFRGIEKYAPWVNRVFFVTCGHLPEWLNQDHPKLQIVTHKEFIPEEYLPTFNSNTILLNLHRIKGLQERFVLFNDDMFLTNTTMPEHFFVKGKPVDAALLSSISSTDIHDVFPHMMLNNIAIINKHFDKKTVLKKHWKKFFSLKYSGKELMKTCMSCGFAGFRELFSRHIPCSYLKTSYQKVWEKEEGILHKTCMHKFRSASDVTEWLIKDWQLCEGTFYPQSHKWGSRFELGEADELVFKAIRNQQFSAICINDSSEKINFDETKEHLISAFSEILPEKSLFERY